MLQAHPSLPASACSSCESKASPQPHPWSQPALSSHCPTAPTQANPGGRDMSSWLQTEPQAEDLFLFLNIFRVQKR